MLKLIPILVCVYGRTGDYEKAIQSYTKAIELNPDDPVAYVNRGEVRLHLGEWEGAEMDLNVAKGRGVDIIASFHKDYESVADFEQKNKVQLPEDIKAMLVQK